MKDEIKEIVRRMNDLIEHQFDKEYYTKCDLFKDIQSLLDYITNLQDENEILKNSYNDLLKMYDNKFDRYLDLKTIIETSIILLNELQEKIINNNYIVTDLDLDNIMKELGDN